MNKFLLIIFLSLLSSSILYSSSDIKIYTASSNGGKITHETIAKTLIDNGFRVAGNNNMNKVFKDRYNGGKDFKTYRLMFFYDSNLASKLSKDYASVGLMTPLCTSVYSKDGTDINIAVLTLDGLSRITGIPKSNKTLKELVRNIDRTLLKALPNGKINKIDRAPSATKNSIVARFQGKLEIDSDIEEAKESFQEDMEEAFETEGFIMSGFTNLYSQMDDNSQNRYDFFDIYSMCNLEVFYKIHKLYPALGAYAPCTLYMYQEKGADKFNLGFPLVSNWIDAANMKDKSTIDVLIDAEKVFAGVLEQSLE